MKDIVSNRLRTSGRVVPRSHGFTLIELVIVFVVLAILAVVALPKFLRVDGDARVAADTASIAGINSALGVTFAVHRIRATPSSQWIDAVDEIAPAMQTGALPAGITIIGAKIRDQRGNTYTLSAETANAAAKLNRDGGGGGGGS